MERWRRARPTERRQPTPSCTKHRASRFAAPRDRHPEPMDQLADFVKQQPFTAALGALVIGYLLGKVT
jgi:hypothetical protein